MAPKHLLALLPLQALLLLAPAGQAHATGTTRFLPDGYRGHACRALKPGCMTKQQWAEICNSRNYYVLPKSCRDALGARPIMPRAYVRPRNVMPAPPIRLPNLKTDVTCLALTDACMGRNN